MWLHVIRKRSDVEHKLCIKFLYRRLKRILNLILTLKLLWILMFTDDTCPNLIRYVSICHWWYLLYVQRSVLGSFRKRVIISQSKRSWELRDQRALLSMSVRVLSCPWSSMTWHSFEDVHNDLIIVFLQVIKHDQIYQDISWFPGYHHQIDFFLYWSNKISISIRSQGSGKIT